jgi:hypothetical protein
MQGCRENLIFVANVAGNLNKDIGLIWILLVEQGKGLEQLNVAENCIHRNIWNISCGVSAPH